MANDVLRPCLRLYERPQLNPAVSPPTSHSYSLLTYRLCCFPISFEAKYYPPVILLLFMLLAGPRLGMIFGLIVGYLEAFKYLDSIILGLNSAVVWE